MQGESSGFFQNIKSTVLWIIGYSWIIMVFGVSQLCASPPGGLKFHGSERPINQRTSYNVFGEKKTRFSEQFNIEFDLTLYPKTEFGYIIRVKNHESNRIYNLFYDGQGSDLIFKFNEEGTHSLIVANISKAELPSLQWFRVKISFDLKRDSIHLMIHNRKFGAENKGLPDTYQPIIVFGRSDHVIDVPTFAIKNLSVGMKERYVFELKEIEGSLVHDQHGNALGKVANPEWLMNDAYHWRHRESFKSQTVAGANYNSDRKQIYYFNEDSLHTYDVRSGITKIQVFEEKCPVDLVLGTNFLDTRQHKLYAYEVFYSSERNYEGATIASLDLNSYQWTAENSKQLPSQLHHHAAFLNPVSREFTIFGGFGNMRYSKNFFPLDLETKEWKAPEQFSGDVISPRYFSSMGYLAKANSMYVFGGMGNESGEQIVGRRYYYDLHKVDLNTKKISKLWEIQWGRDNVVPVRGMVILDDSYFYTLCYPEHFSESFLKLYRFSLKDGSYEILGDSIPIYSDKIATNANLYYDSDLNSLYAVVQEFEDDIASDLKVYSLAFPPITASELASYSSTKSDDRWLVILVSIALLGAFGYTLFRKLRSKTEEEASISNNSSAQKKIEVTIQPNSIYLFGDFMVRDRKNRDITYMFSEQLRQVFCILLQHSTTEDGIASPRLSSILWPDKPADKVKNSRGVTMNHLRKALSELDGIELIYEKGFFKIVQRPELYCDYTRCLEIISANQMEDYRDEFVGILSRGRFLQLSDHPIFDSFKEETEKKLEPALLLEMEKSYDAELFHSTIAFAAAMFNIDPLNDTALGFQVRAMQRLKMNDEAKMRYQAFVTEYKKVMGTDYPHPYKG